MGSSSLAHRWSWRAMLALSLAACSTDAPVEGASEPLEAIGPVEAPEPARRPERAGDAVVLDARAGQTLTGRLRPFPLDADPMREIDLDPASTALVPELAGAPVLDARFAGDAVVVLGTDRVLRVRTSDGRVEELDVAVHAPLSVVGTSVTYARGEIPELEIARADVATGEVLEITHGMAPAWSPTLSEDGRSIVFVSGIRGTPHFYRVEGVGTPHELPPDHAGGGAR